MFTYQAVVKSCI